MGLGDTESIMGLFVSCQTGLSHIYITQTSAFYRMKTPVVLDDASSAIPEEKR